MECNRSEDFNLDFIVVFVVVFLFKNLFAAPKIYTYIHKGHTDILYESDQRAATSGTVNLFMHLGGTTRQVLYDFFYSISYVHILLLKGPVSKYKCKI